MAVLLLLSSQAVFRTLCNPMNCSTPIFPVLHCLPEFAQTHVRRVSDAIQASRPLSLPSPPPSMAARWQVFFTLSPLRLTGSLAHTGGLQSLMTVTSLFLDMAGNLLCLRA